MDQRERFEAWAMGEFGLAALPTRKGDGYRLQGVDDAWAGWQAAEAAALERAAKLIEPTNPPDDWTEYARIKAECAAAIRKLAAPVERGDKS
jgi:hypothetical protein